MNLIIFLLLTTAIVSNTDVPTYNCEQCYDVNNQTYCVNGNETVIIDYSKVGSIYCGVHTVMDAEKYGIYIGGTWDGKRYVEDYRIKFETEWEREQLEYARMRGLEELDFSLTFYERQAEEIYSCRYLIAGIIFAIAVIIIILLNRKELTGGDL